MRFFNTAGPVNCQDHYYIPSLTRFDLPEILISSLRGGILLCIHRVRVVRPHTFLHVLITSTKTAGIMHSTPMWRLARLPGRMFLPLCGQFCQERFEELMKFILILLHSAILRGYINPDYWFIIHLYQDFYKIIPVMDIFKGILLSMSFRSGDMDTYIVVLTPWVWI